MRNLMLAVLAVVAIGMFATTCEASGRYWRRAYYPGPPHVVVRPVPVVPHVRYYGPARYYSAPYIRRDYYVAPPVRVYRTVPSYHYYPGPRISVGIGF